MDETQSENTASQSTMHPTRFNSLALHKQHELGEGSEGKVYSVQVTVEHKGKERTVPWTMAYKVFDKDKRGLLEKVMDNYKVAREANLPVPETFRQTESGNIVMTDLSNGGKNLVLAPNDFIDGDEKIKTMIAQYPTLIDTFTNKVDLGADALKERIKIYSELAAKKHFQFYVDSWFLIVEPDGSFDLSVVDFGNTGVNQNRSEENITRTNIFYLTNEIEYFQDLQSALRNGEYSL